MNYDKIAELVHELAKNPNRCSEILPQLKSISKITNCELDSITKVFTKEKLAGDSLAATMSPTLYWF